MGTIPTSPSFVAGEKLTAAKLNQMVDVANFWALTPRCYAYQTAAQSIPNNAYTSVNLDTEVYDVVQSGDTAGHDTATDNSRIYIRTTGKYEVLASVMFTVNGTGVRSVRVIKNGSTATEYAFGTDAAQAANNTQVSTTSVEIPLVAGDYLEVQAFQNSGGALNLIANGLGKTFLRVKLTGS